VAERLVFISGGAYTKAGRDFVRSVRNQVLEKPVRPEVLLAHHRRDAGLRRRRGP
jgi:hypothetical protein